MKLEKFEINSIESIYGIQGKFIDVPSENVHFGSMLGILKPGESTRKHAHHDHESFVIISGEGILEGENEKIEVGLGDIIYLEPGDYHTLKNTEAHEKLIFTSLWWAFSEGAVISKRNYFSKKTGIKRLIFSPPPTPNGDLHLGHISGPYLSADILKRSYLQRGDEVLYFSGSDDNQSYVELKAKQMQISSDLVADHFSSNIQSVLKQYNADPDLFYGPLHDKDYTDFVVEFFRKLFDSSIIKTKICSQPYCEQCNIWLFEAHMSGLCPHCNSPCGGGSCETCGLPNLCVDVVDSFCKFCKKKPILKETKQVYLPLQNYHQKIKQYLERINLPAHIRALVRTALDKKLPDLLITHQSHWGITAPFEGFEEQKLCSWCEMAPGYLFLIHKVVNEQENWKNFLKDPNSKITLFFGFDNTYFYTIIMTALYLAFDESIKLPDEIIYNEFYLFDKLKFSTSRGHAVWAKDIIKKVTSDVLRYYLSATRPEIERTQFTYLEFVKLVNTDLADELSGWISNLAIRINSDFNGICPDGGEWVVEHEEFVRYLQKFLIEVTQAYEPPFFSPANIIKLLKELVSRVKKLSLTGSYLIANNSFSKLEYQTTLVLELTALKYYAMVCSPIMPEFSEKLFNALGFKKKINWETDVRLLAKNTEIKNLSSCTFMPISIALFETVRKEKITI